MCLCVCVYGGVGGDRVVRGEAGGIEGWGEGKVRDPECVHMCVRGKGRDGREKLRDRCMRAWEGFVFVCR